MGSEQAQTIFISVSEAAGILGVATYRIREYCREGLLGYQTDDRRRDGAIIRCVDESSVRNLMPCMPENRRMASARVVSRNFAGILEYAVGVYGVEMGGTSWYVDEACGMRYISGYVQRSLKTGDRILGKAYNDAALECCVVDVKGKITGCSMRGGRIILEVKRLGGDELRDNICEDFHGAFFSRVSFE